MNNEFKKSKSNNETRYTLESMTAGATGSSNVATATGSLGKVQKRGNILAQEADKKKDGPKPRNFVAKNAKSGGAGAHKDKKKEQKQGAAKHKKPYMESLRTKIDQLKTKLAEHSVAEGVRDLGYDAQSLIMKLRRDVEEKRLQPTPQAVLAAARELAGDMKFAPQLLVKQVLGQGVAEGDDIGYHQTSGTKAGHTISSRKLSNKPQASKSDVTLQSGSMHHSGKSYDFPKGTLFTQLPGGIFAKHPSVPETHPGYGHLIRRSEDNIHAIHNALNGQQGVGEGMMDNPGEQDSPVAQAIIRRILLQRTDLLAKHGPEKVGQAVDEVADFVGDVDEIGSSDVSGWVRHVEQMLGNMEQDVAEGNMISKIKAPSSPALAIPKAPAVAETIARVERMLESVTSKKSAEMIKAYVDQKFTELGLRNTTECQNLMAHVVHESAVRRRAYAQRMAK
jgi:hypothetical protein